MPTSDQPAMGDVEGLIADPCAAKHCHMHQAIIPALRAQAARIAELEAQVAALREPLPPFAARHVDLPDTVEGMIERLEAHPIAPSHRRRIIAMLRDQQAQVAALTEERDRSQSALDQCRGLLRFHVECVGSLKERLSDAEAQVDALTAENRRLHDGWDEVGRVADARLLRAEAAEAQVALLKGALDAERGARG